MENTAIEGELTRNSIQTCLIYDVIKLLS